MNHLLAYLLTFSISICMSLALTALFIRVAPSLGLLDHPSEDRQTHTKITPLAGGVAIFFAFNLTCWLIYNYFLTRFNGYLTLDWWAAFFVASSILLVVGLIDDRFGVSPKVKLLGQAIATCTLYYLSNSDVNLFQTDFSVFWTFIFILIWNLAIINAFNLIDGLDGLCSGLATIPAIGLTLVFILRGSFGDSLICLALAGACLGFLKYNFYPAKVFLGDTGSMFLGFALANISLHVGSEKSSLFAIVAMVVFIAGVPIFDTFLAIWRRSIRKLLLNQSGRKDVRVMGADTDHLHHRLLKLDFSPQQIALRLYAVSTTIVIIGTLYIVSKSQAIGLFLITFTGLIYLLTRYILHIEIWETCRLLVVNNQLRININNWLKYFDFFWVLLAVWVSNTIVGEHLEIASFDWKAINLLFWLAPTLGFLHLSKIYSKIWQNSFFKDYVFLALSILAGSSISLGLFLFLLMDQWENYLLIVNRDIVFCFISLVGIMGVRLPYHIARELSFTKSGSRANNACNILIYGAGKHGGLYLQNLHLKYTNNLGEIHIAGFIDDNKVLHGQSTYGSPVLGGITALKELIKQFDISRIILTTTISKQNVSLLKEITESTKVELLTWDSSCV